MEKTGESYATARRIVLRHAPAGDRKAIRHFAGNIPATTALRILLTQFGIRNPITMAPFTEEMLFGIAGGIGAGAFSFLYEKENFACFFIAGRHMWMDDEVYLKEACQRLGVEAVVKESTAAKAAEKQLRETLDEFGACIAWVDAATLPHRAMPAMWSGGGYHLVTAYRIDDESGTVLIGDLTDEPIAISMKGLTAARMRIKKQKNRLLAVRGEKGDRDLGKLVRSGIEACIRGLTRQRMKNFTIDALQEWADRLHGSKDKQSWERVFTPGKRLWQGLTSIYDYIEHYGTGGGLCRPMFADSLNEAADALNDPRLSEAASRYEELGRAWSELAKAALHPGVPLFRKARELFAEKAELLAAGAPADEVRGVWTQIGKLADQAAECFPLSDKQVVNLRIELQQKVRALYEGERAALETLRRLVVA